MKPIYFPFTYVGDEIAQALAACFQQTTVYQPLEDKLPADMVPWIQRGILDMRVPVSNSGEAIEAAAKNFVEWANLHQRGAGIKSIFCSLREYGVPFSEHSSPSQIAAELKALSQGRSSLTATDPIFLARVFLYLAQEFDRQNQEVARDLKRHRQQEAKLIRQLKMEDDSLTAEFQKEAVPAPDDSADSMVLDRLKAWTRILLKGTDISGVFITHIPAVLQELLDKTPTAEKLLSLESIPTRSAMTAETTPWRQKLVSDLAHIVEHKWSPNICRPFDHPGFPAAANTVSLNVYLVPDQTPRYFFSRCAQIHLPDEDASHPGGRLKNTLIGLIEF